MPIHPDTPIYEIGTAARRCGLPVTTLRTWEDRYGTVTPTRSDVNGRRLYSEANIEDLRQLADLIDSGLKAAEAHRLLKAHRAANGGS